MNILEATGQSISTRKFKELAREIPSDPMERLPTYTADLFDRVLDQTTPSPPIFIDAHAHAFTYKNIPEDFLKYDQWLPRLLRRTALKLVKPGFMRSIEADSPIKLVKKLLRKYFSAPQHNFGIRDTFIVLLMMDMERGIGGRVREPFHEQLAQVCRMLRTIKMEYRGHEFIGRRHLLPFLAIDPHNPDAYEYFLSAFLRGYNSTPVKDLDHTAPFQGVKIYPALGYVPHHPTLMEIFAICEQKRIPVTTHTGGHRTHPSFDAVDAEYRVRDEEGWQDRKKRIQLLGRDRTHFARFFLDPTHWYRRVLSEFPRLKLNLAHFGNNDDWRRYRRDRHSMVHRTLVTMRKYENVYADISYTFYHKRNLREINQLMEKEELLRSRIIYGSDFYLCDVERKEVSDFYAQVFEIMKRRDIQEKLFYENAVRFLCG